MNNKERMIIIATRNTIPGVGAPPRAPIVPLAELEQEVADDEAFEELQTGETQQMPIPHVSFEDEETDVYEIGPYRTAGEVYWVALV